jgi:insulysin
MTALPRFLFSGLTAALTGLLLTTGPWQASLASDITVSPNDSRSYSLVTLENGLRALLVSDPETDKAAVSLDVNVGSSDDPQSLQGLAHFLEHMLFLGTEKYPAASEYQDFLTSHGGTHNAYTSNEHTNYFFDVDKDYLEPTLDRFAQFFVAPLFSAEYVAREVNAVDSEYRSNLRSDQRRVYYAWKQLVNPEHPLAKFATGNLDTLRDGDERSLRDELIEFYQAHYSANLMTLVVLGKEPLNELEQWVEQKFSTVKDYQRQTSTTNVALYKADQLPVRLWVRSVKDEPTLEFSFPVPPVRAHYRTKPLFYIAYLVGHEGRGSLLSSLKDKGWADGLAAGQEFDNSDVATFGISINLTHEGLNKIDDIVDEVFAYLALVRREGVQQQTFEEQSRLLRLKFEYRDKVSPQDYVQELSLALQIYPARDVLRAEYEMDQFDAELIHDYLARLTPENVAIIVSATDVQADQTEPWFGAEYRKEALSEQLLARWRGTGGDYDFALPEPNPFIPEHLILKELVDASEKPRRIIAGDGLEVWFQQDARFRSPKADIYLNLRSQFSNDLPRNAVLTELYVEAIKDRLNEALYPAIVAGLDYKIYKHIRGISVRISGYDEKQPELLERIIAGSMDLNVDPDRFALLKLQLKRKLANAAEERPYVQAIGRVSDLLLVPHWPEAQLLEAVRDLTATDLQEFIPRFLSRAETIALVHGNVRPTEARAIGELISDELLSQITAASVARGEVLSLSPGKRFAYLFPVAGNDSAVLVYLQGKSAERSQDARYQLLGQIISSPFYSALRTEQQLGYIVFSFPLPVLEAPGLAFAVQSPIADVATISQRIDEFLAGFESVVAGLSEQELEAHKAGVLTRIFENEDKLEDVSDRYWSEIDRGEYDFDSREQLAKEVRALSKEDLLTFYRSEILSESQRRYLKIVAQRDGRESQPVYQGDEAIEDALIFKAKGPFIDLDAATR